MHKLFDFLDEVLSELLPLLYLFGTTFGTIYFFVGRQFLDIGSILQQDPLKMLAFIAGVTAAVGTELHAYLQQRRARQSNQELLRTPEDHPNYAQVVRSANAARCWMIALLLFQVVSSEGFWLTTIDLAHASIFDWLSVLVRGAAIPVFLYGTGYLSRLRQDAVGILAKAAEKMLTKTMSVAGKQWGKRLETSARSGVNLANVAVDLLNDAGETQAAKRVQLIETALSPSGQNASATVGFVRDNTSGLYVPRSQKSTGAKRSTVDHPRTAPRTAVLEGGETATEQHRGGLSLFPGRKPRKPIKKTPEQRVFAVLDKEPDASLRRIEKEAHVSHQTAVDMRAKWQEQWQEERSAEASLAAVS